ncbi:condensation protein [Methanofollis formosanus]|uniref:Condensation protein n=1 Tax=Methanofollis formosanus TaxID=299308 RepID=A0A8G1EGG7_9EURY|nr:condensation protein [Methanofollis formosanus]QYZ79154.1 condensation protein [Methanofollis formosanus]
MSSQPAPAFDLFNVYFERLYDPTMHLLLAFDGEVDEAVLKKATLRLLGSNPYLRSRFAEEEEGMPCWEEIAEEEWERAFVILPPGEHLRPPAPLDVRRGPQVRVSLARQEDGDRIVVTCHHGFCDAKGIIDLARRLFEVYREIKEDPDFRPAPLGWYDRGTERVLAQFTAEEIKQARDEEEPFVDRWRFPIVRQGRGTPRIAHRTLSPDRLRQAKEFGRRHGATVNDIMIAAFFLAHLKIRDDPSDLGAPRSILTSADLRRHLDHPEACPPMNLSVAYEVTLTAGEGTGLEDIIDQVTAVTKRRKADGLGIGCILFYDEIYAGGMPGVRAFFDEMIRRYEETGLKNPVFSNIGVLDAAEFLPVDGKDGHPLDLRNLCFLPCVCWPYGFLISLSTFRESMTIVTGYEKGPYSEDMVERFLDAVVGYLP